MREMTIVFLLQHRRFLVSNSQLGYSNSIHRRSALYGYSPRNESPMEIHRANLSGCWCRNIKVPTLYGVRRSRALHNFGWGPTSQERDSCIEAAVASLTVKLQRHHIGFR